MWGRERDRERDLWGRERIERGERGEGKKERERRDVWGERVRDR